MFNNLLGNRSSDGIVNDKAQLPAIINDAPSTPNSHKMSQKSPRLSAAIKREHELARLVHEALMNTAALVKLEEYLTSISNSPGADSLYKAIIACYCRDVSARIENYERR